MQPEVALSQFAGSRTGLGLPGALGTRVGRFCWEARLFFAPNTGLSMCWESRFRLLTRLTRCRISDRVRQLSHECPSFLIFAGKMPPPSGGPCRSCVGKTPAAAGPGPHPELGVWRFCGRVLVVPPSRACAGSHARPASAAGPAPDAAGCGFAHFTISFFSSRPLIFGGRELFS